MKNQINKRTILIASLIVLLTTVIIYFDKIHIGIMHI
jgi:hypothetical protein